MAKREAGIIVIDGQQVGSTKQCCHCGGHFMMVKGSGKLRGWCMKCNEVTCGKFDCCKCVPFEKKLELVEAGKLVFV
jgi:hypothetical protein